MFKNIYFITKFNCLFYISLDPCVVDINLTSRYLLVYLAQNYVRIKKRNVTIQMSRCRKIHFNDHIFLFPKLIFDSAM